MKLYCKKRKRSLMYEHKEIPKISNWINKPKVNFIHKSGSFGKRVWG